MRQNICSKAIVTIFYCFLLVSIHSSFSQGFDNFFCYTTDGFILYEYDSAVQQWRDIDTIFSFSSGSSRNRFHASAIKPNSNLLYTVDQNIFGYINVNTAEFTALNYVSNLQAGYGEYGYQIFDDIHAMTYAPYNHCIWAINNNANYRPGTEDFLIKIDCYHHQKSRRL